MDRNACQQFFLQPDGIEQRHYEVLRAVFVDEDTARDVAERFGLSHGTVRNWASQFSAQLECGEPPPFSMAAARRGADWPMRTHHPRLRTFKSFPWSQDGGCGRARRGSFCSCRSWHGCASIGSWNRRAIPARRKCLPRVPC